MKKKKNKRKKSSPYGCLRGRNWTGKYNTIAVFDIPINVEGVDVYGLLLYLDDDEDMDRLNDKIRAYINSYLIPMSRMAAKGEYKDGRWYFPEYGIDVAQNMGLYKFFEVLFDDLVGFTLIRNGNIVSKRTEADGDFIIDKALIDRYSDSDAKDTNYTNTKNISI